MSRLDDVVAVDLSPETIAAALQCPLSRAQAWAPHLNKAMTDWQICIAKRQAAFLAQIGHESGRLVYVRELASGAAYEGRADLGNTHPGDGVRFKGRGLIQITGRLNYAKCQVALDLNLIDHPELLERPEFAAASAGWFWFGHGLNDLADQDDFVSITRRINGGTNGMDDRLALWKSACTALGG